MNFGLTIEKLLLIGVLAALLIGPERLPRYAEALASFVKRARDFTTNARARVKDEMGEDFSDVDWRTLDPRQYDPRRIIREALLEEPTPAAKPQSATMKPATPQAPAAAPLAAAASADESGAPPYDTEAT